MNVRDIILGEMARVALEQKKTLRQLGDDMDLASIGLDSLCFAILVARLEERFGIDPFADESTLLPVTLADLIGLYQRLESANALCSAVEPRAV